MALRTDIGDPSSLLDISSFLNRWLVTHIQGEDQKFGRFAAED
jgi:hemerythrin